MSRVPPERSSHPRTPPRTSVKPRGREPSSATPAWRPRLISPMSGSSAARIPSNIAASLLPRSSSVTAVIRLRALPRRSAAWNATSAAASWSASSSEDWSGPCFSRSRFSSAHPALSSQRFFDSSRAFSQARRKASGSVNPGGSGALSASCRAMSWPRRRASASRSTTASIFA